MRNYAILAQSDVSAAAIEAALARFRKNAFGTDETAKMIIVTPDCLAQSESGVDLFDACSTILNEVVYQPRIGHQAVGLVEVVHPSLLTAASESASWDHLVAMLILAFPDIRWVFMSVEDDAASFPAASHSLPTLACDFDREALFDPTGLREWVRQRTMESIRKAGLAGEDVNWFPRRVQLAASIDDEQTYAFYHAYVAYRYGFRSDVVASWRAMDELFGPNGTTNGEYALLFEDMRLNFADRPLSIHLTDLAQRGKHCPRLALAADQADWRFLISTGQMHGDDAIIADNMDLLQKKTRGRGDVLWKPVGGIIDLWARAGLIAELGGGTRRNGNADDFEWPLNPVTTKDGKGHAAPGKLLLISETLLRGAERIAGEGTSVISIIRAAVHASEAVEISTGRTPTSSLSAMALRQELEVKAECSFVGAGFHVGTERRLTELGDEMASVAHWFHADVRRKAALDARVSTISRLVLVFRNAGKLEEETACLNALRVSNRELSRPTSMGSTLWDWGVMARCAQAWLRHCFLWYAEWVLTSVDRLIGVTIGWLAALSCIAWALSRLTATPLGFGTAVAQAGSWFLGTSTTSEWCPLAPLSWVAAGLGVFHLGLLISYLYSLIARK